MLMNSFSISILAFTAIFLGLSGCAAPESQPMPSDAHVETGHITGKKLVARVDRPSSVPVGAGVGGGAISGGGFGGVGLGIDLTSLFSPSAKAANIYEYEVTTADNRVLKVNSDTELKEGDCAKAVVSDHEGMSRIEGAPSC